MKIAMKTLVTTYSKNNRAGVGGRFVLQKLTVHEFFRTIMLKLKLFVSASFSIISSFSLKGNQ